MKTIDLVKMGVCIAFFDNEAKQAVKSYGLLKDAGYYCILTWTRNLGFDLQVAIKPNIILS